MNHLPLNLEKFGFVEREKRNDQTVRNKCGRDFLYYSLHHLAPSRFNPKLNDPVEIDRKKLFGIPVPTWLAWTQVQFMKVPALLKQNNLELRINNIMVRSFLGFIYAILFSEISYEDAIRKIEGNVNKGMVSGVDLALGWQGLVDHVLFVHGYDEENLYVFDTHQIPKLEYEKLTSDYRYYMRLPKVIVKNRWKRFSRVWEVRRVE